MNRIRKQDTNVICVRLSRNFGEHAALLAGLSVCTGDCAVTKQADLQEDSEIILDMYKSWEKGMLQLKNAVIPFSLYIYSVVSTSSTISSFLISSDKLFTSSFSIITLTNNKLSSG